MINDGLINKGKKMLTAKVASELSVESKEQLKIQADIDEKIAESKARIEFEKKCKKFATIIERNHEESILNACDEGKREVEYVMTDEHCTHCYASVTKEQYKEILKNEDITRVKGRLEDKGFKVKIKRCREHYRFAYSLYDSCYEYMVNFIISW